MECTNIFKLKSKIWITAWIIAHRFAVRQIENCVVNVTQSTQLSISLMKTKAPEGLENLTSEEIHALVGKQIRVRLKREGVEGKIFQNNFPCLDGYSFIYKDNKKIMEIGGIFPEEVTPEYFPELAVRISRDETGEYLLRTTGGFGFMYHYQGEPEYKELNNFLIQKTFDFPEAEE